jgi:hypothetical protein
VIDKRRMRRRPDTGQPLTAVAWGAEAAGGACHEAAGLSPLAEYHEEQSPFLYQTPVISHHTYQEPVRQLYYSRAPKKRACAVLRALT